MAKGRMRAFAVFSSAIALLNCSAQKTLAAPGQLMADGSGWQRFVETPAQRGNPRDYGYNDVAIARWDTVPWQTIAAGQTLHIGIVAFHQGTAAEQQAGLANPVAGSNIDHISVSVDGGTWTDVAVASTNVDEGVWEYNFEVQASDFRDGPHEARAVVYPRTGRALVLQGPMRVNGDQGSISASSLTMPNATLGYGQVLPGMSVNGPGVAAGTIITGPCSRDREATICPISPSQTTPMERLRLGETPGLFFFTNSHASKPAALRYVSTTGVDSPSCGRTSHSPCLTIDRAKENAYADHVAAGVHDIGGATICVQAGTYDDIAGPLDDTARHALQRWLTIESSGHGPCDGVNAGPVNITHFSRNMGITRLHLAYLNLIGDVKAGGVHQTAPPDDPALWLDHINYVGASWMHGYVAHVADFTQGIFCTESSITNAENGCSNAALARNMTETWIASDAFQYAHMIVNSKVTNNTPSPGTGDTVTGSPIIRNFTGADHVAVGDCIYNKAVLADSSCIVAVEGSQITLNHPAVGAGKAVRFDAGINAAAAEHPDIWQQAAFTFNWIAYGLDASANVDPQGLFPDGSAFSQAVVHSSFRTGQGGYVMQTGGPQQNWFWSGNHWVGSMLWGPGPYVDVLQHQDVCTQKAKHPPGITLSASPTC